MLMTEWNWDDALEVRWEEGREEGRRETAKNLKEMGLPIDQIAAATGLDPELIRTL
jgi:predicted transposase/invertase (TIGR01784 family)